MEKEEGLLEIRSGTLSFGPILLKGSDGAILSSLSLSLSLPLTLTFQPPPTPIEERAAEFLPEGSFLGRPGLFRASATAVTFTTLIWEGRSTESWSRQKAGKLGVSLV